MARVGVKNRVGGMRFDADLKTDHTQKLTMTQHPVEKGADISDHAFIEPSEVGMEVAMSDVSSGDGKSAAAFRKLLALQSSLDPLTVVTRLKTYRNMMIESVSSPDDYSTMFGMKATILFREMKLVTTSTVKVSSSASSDPQKSGETNKGTSQPQSGSSTNQSVLSQAASKLFG